jgi:RHS repeat-associated protein
VSSQAYYAVPDWHCARLHLCFAGKMRADRASLLYYWILAEVLLTRIAIGHVENGILQVIGLPRCIARIYAYDSSGPKDGPDSYGNSTVGYTTYGYDANGNQITRAQNGSTQTRTFDPEGRITQIIEGNTTTTMVYDGNGQRIIKDVNVVTATPTNTPTATPTNTALPSGCQAVSWTSGVNVSISGNSIQKTNSNNWDGGAVSSSGQSITSGNGYVQAKVDSTQYNVMFGLSNGNSNQGYSDIDFAAHLQGGGALMVYEGGTYKGTFGTYAVNDIIKVAVESGQVKYYKNGSLFYTSAGDVSYPLLMDSSIYEIGAWIKDALICSTGTGSGPGAGTGQDKTASTTATAIAGTSQGESAGPAALNTVSSRTLYIGSMYEEDISNTSDPTPPYTSYYTFSGKLVGMRLANQPDSPTDGQLRVVGDHLGSATLVIDTSSTPQVIHRQFYKPYGEVALQSGTTRTSIGYTGQRLDEDSGLMFYNARFYDPVLSYFVSADTIAPNPAEPQTRNRYSYVLNNPVKYSDPSGHCRKDTADDSDARKACEDYLYQLGRYGIEIGGDLGEWTLEDVFLVLTAIKDMAAAGNWSPEDFKREMGLKGSDKITLLNEDLNSGNHSGCRNINTACTRGQTTLDGRTIKIDLKAAREYRKYTRDDPVDGLKRTMVHELAHVWHIASGSTGPVSWAASDELWNNVSGQSDSVAGVPSQYAKDARNGLVGVPPAEYFAEAVAAYVYPTSKKFTSYSGNTYGAGTTAYDYVAAKFGNPVCQPGKSC